MKAYGVNRHGEVVGTADVASGDCFVNVGFIWLPKPKYGLDAGTHFLEDHDPNDELATFAYDINDEGIVVGQVEFCPSCDAMIWDLDQGLVGTPMNASTDTAWAVNNAADYEVAGAYSSGRAFVWHSATDTFNVYLPQGGWNNAAAFDLNTPATNDPLVVAGWSGNSTGGVPDCMPVSDAVAWSDNSPQILIQPTGFSNRGNEIRGETQGVNNAGQMAGYGRYHDTAGQTPTCIDYALAWDSTTSVAMNLGVEVTNPAHQSYSYAINPPGDIVVGHDLDANEAALWTLDGTIVYLRLCDLAPNVVCSGTTPPAGYWRLWTARDINPCDYICGWGDRADLDCFGPRTEAYLAILPPLPCPADTNGDDVVDVQDLVNVVVLYWNTSNPAGDVNDDGIVNVQDMVLVVLNWGVCPCNIVALNPLSLAQELQEGGLTQDDWDDFLDNIDNENYRCWMGYHLVGGTPNCPGADPY
jgi:hypothetical protein